ncbi:MAG: nuclear transport factor 2 family protein [Candidatus Binatia bacterium]
MENEVGEVTTANAAFYHAFETLEIAEMEKVWLRASHIKCVHPGWPLLCGWGPVMASWERIFENTFAMQFTLTDVRVEVCGSLAWVVLIENLESQGYDGPARSQILTTNILEKQNGQWFIIHHHASPIFAPLSPGETQLQ